MQVMNDDSYNLNEKQASEIIGVSSRTLRRWRNTNQSPPYFYTPNKRPKYNAKEIHNWIDRMVRNKTMQADNI